MPPPPISGSEPSTPHPTTPVSVGTLGANPPAVQVVQAAGEGLASPEPQINTANEATTTNTDTAVDNTTPTTAPSASVSAPRGNGDTPAVTSSMSAPPYTPDPANTRALLRSLEDLRDSLSVRVEQLSLAVDRLRGQATELERAVSTGTALAPGFGRPRAFNTANTFEPLPRPHLGVPRQHTVDVASGATTGVPGLRNASSHLRRAGHPRLSDSAVVTETVIRHHGGFSDRRPRGPTPPPLAMPARRTGLTPTNLTVVATQPKPTVVRSPPVASSEPEGTSSNDDETPPLPPSPRPVPLQPVEPSPQPLADGITVETTTTTEQDALSPPDLALRFWGEAARARPARRHNPTSSSLAPGMTLTGMRVEERIRAAAGEPAVPPANASAPLRPFPSPRPNIPRGREELDREIHQVHRRLDESQRDWYSYWNAERTRTLHTGGRFPNEYSVGRENAMRTHVENSHLLWTLVSRRTRLYGGPATTDTTTPTEARLGLDPMRHIIETPPSFLRAGSNTAGSRRWDPYADLDDLSFQRREETREARSQSRQSEWLLLDLVERQYTEPAVNPAEVRDDDLLSPPPVDPEILGLRNNLRALERINAEMPTYRYTQRPQNADLATSPEASSTARNSDALSWNSFDDDLPPRLMRQQLLRYIERSRERVHQIARDLTPELLATEEPAMRRVLDGIELMMASPNITPHIRSRLERLAERERGLLRDLERGLTRNNGRNRTTERSDRPAIAPGAFSRLPPASPEPSPATLPNPSNLQLAGDPILDRIERSRARVRDLSRVYRELQATRASLGFDSAPRPESFSRRGSDAETIVPLSFSVSDGVTTDDDEVPPPIPAPPARLSGQPILQPPATTGWAAPSASDEVAEQAPPPIQRPMTVSPVQVAADFVVPMEATGSSSSSASSGSSSSSASSSSSTSSRATISHVRDEEPTSAERKESGEFETQEWPSPPPPRRPVRPYVSILDLE